MIKLHTAISRVTTRALPPSFGKDKGRWLTVTLVPGNGDEVEDLITIRPHGTRRPETISLEAVYLFALRSRVNKEVLERARERKAAKEAAKERAAIARADRKLRKEAIAP